MRAGPSLAIACAMLSALPRVTATGHVHPFLVAQFGLDGNDLRKLDRGEPVARTLTVSEGREVATVGVIRIGVPASFYVDQLREIVEFKRDQAVLQIGTFSQPARMDDVSGLQLERDDLDKLRRCRPAACRVQLSADAIRRFQQEVPWDTPLAFTAAHDVMRGILIDVVERYRQSGDDGLMIYADGARPLSLADEFRAMVNSPPAVLRRFPVLHDHLVQFPHAGGGAVEDVFYWSKERMGPAVIVSVTHLAIARLAGSSPASYAVASKQIYGTHYFDSSLGITLLLDDEAAAARSYLVYVNRSRLDALGGFLGGVKRAVVRSRTRAAMSNSLAATRDRVEQRFRSRPAAIGRDWR